MIVLGHHPRILRAIMVNKVAESLWKAESIRASGKDRNVPWHEAGEEAHKQFRPLAVAAIDTMIDFGWSPPK